METSQRSVATQQMPNQEKATCKMIGNPYPTLSLAQCSTERSKWPSSPFSSSGEKDSSRTSMKHSYLSVGYPRDWLQTRLVQSTYREWGMVWISGWWPRKAVMGTIAHENYRETTDLDVWEEGYAQRNTIQHLRPWEEVWVRFWEIKTFAGSQRKQEKKNTENAHRPRQDACPEKTWDDLKHTPCTVPRAQGLDK